MRFAAHPHTRLFFHEKEKERDRRARGDGRSALLRAATVSEKLRLVCDWTIC